MRNYRLIVALLVATLTTGVISAPASAGTRPGSPDPIPVPAQKTFQLLCRGGGNMTTQRGGPVPDANGVEMVVIVVRFSRSARPAKANGSGLKPGQCAWIDRAVNFREPNELRFKVPLHAEAAPGTGGKASTAAERAADAFSVPDYLKEDTHYYTFSAYNSNQGHLRATDSKYFKP